VSCARRPALVGINRIDVSDTSVLITSHYSEEHIMKTATSPLPQITTERAKRGGLLRRCVLLTASAVSAVAASTVMSVTPAAAAAGWQHFDANGDRIYEMAVYRDAWSRIARVVYDTNWDRNWDIDAYIDVTTRTWSAIRLDQNFNGVWETDVRWYQWDRTQPARLAILSDRFIEGDGSWDELTFADGYLQCRVQNGPMPTQDPVYRMWWGRCYDTGLGTGSAAIISAKIYPNVFDYLARATGVAPAAHCVYYPNDPLC
jgi:hypothetical protein